MNGLDLKVREGILRGKIQENPNGFAYCCFQGIPYAQPPIGNLRFKDPIPVDCWDSIKDATVEGGICPQIGADGNLTGNEDCLYLNVYTPHISKPDLPLPVMVWIHGGGFFKGSGNYDSYGPDYIIENNVVYVTLNYRFSVLGFLCLHTPDVPGNAGLKDQMLALRWIKDNIQVFGGDPNNITVFGESAGAASIDFLSLSPNTRDLFHKVIIQSGSSLCPWAIQSKPIPYVFKLAESLGCTHTDFKVVLEYLQSVKIEDLMLQSSKVLSEEDFKIFLPCAFLPVIEKRFDNVKSILTEDPEETIKAGKMKNLPTIVGYSSKESIIMFEKIKFDLNRIGELVDDFKNVLPQKTLSRAESAEILAKSVKEFYFKNKNVDIETLQELIDLLSDCLFRHPMDYLAKLFVKYSSAPVYYFQFSYLGNLNRCKELLNKLNVKAATHSEECCYIFKKKLLAEIKPSDVDILVRDRMVQMWTNFAKFGNPTPQLTNTITTIWKPVTNVDTIDYLEISDDLISGVNPNAVALNFWINLRNAEL